MKSYHNVIYTTQTFPTIFVDLVPHGTAAITDQPKFDSENTLLDLWDKVTPSKDWLEVQYINISQGNVGIFAGM